MPFALKPDGGGLGIKGLDGEQAILMSNPHLEGDRLTNRGAHTLLDHTGDMGASVEPEQKVVGLLDRSTPNAGPV